MEEKSHSAPNNLHDITINERAVNHLKSASTWMRFLGLFGLITGIMATLGIFISILVGDVDSYGYQGSLDIVLSSAILLVFSVTGIILGIIILKASKELKKSIKLAPHDSFEQAFRWQFIYWRLVGIIIISGLVITIIIMATAG